MLVRERGEETYDDGMENGTDSANNRSQGVADSAKNALNARDDGTHCCCVDRCDLEVWCVVVLEKMC